MTAPHRVAILVLDAVVPLDLGIPAQVFEPPDVPTPYRTTLCARVPGLVPSTNGFAVTVDAGLDGLRSADTVVVPGFAPHLRTSEPAILDALATAHARGARMVSICTGAFALAAAGVLDGRTVATHWRHAGELAAGYPEVQVDRKALYVDEGQVLTSAGVAAGIDLCLHLVRRDLGVKVANRVARGLVAAPHREGGQAQYVEHPLPARTGGGSLAATRAWALEHLHRPLPVALLAEHACMSPRTFARRFVDETGVTPFQWLLTARLNRARELLEDTDWSVDQIAERCGLGSPSNLRLHFRRVLGTSPSAYRVSFAGRS
ncbi:GlxA family transcriptional regulator [Streptomyces halobius]|uniref:Helix-turn-helix domain-containing protein n=1 Tax=Streptomyces halobius TaxID=2879846 RepID=A0ABY4LYR3_9ACTN|nr:helix-turn-helix domain-containing protein [Streptomyces halobius]UQA90649.1 helix-turn-helix domain-containing protein [Streptomyces halobius]